MGLVTQKEADIAVRLVRTITGVQKIVKAFEYI
jgi:osmotically-inducible protein OsmY